MGVENIIESLMNLIKATSALKDDEYRIKNKDDLDFVLKRMRLILLKYGSRRHNDILATKYDNYIKSGEGTPLGDNIKGNTPYDKLYNSTLGKIYPALDNDELVPLEGMPRLANLSPISDMQALYNELQKVVKMYKQNQKVKALTTVFNKVGIYNYQDFLAPIDTFYKALLDADRAQSEEYW